jgi:hypothetical protein
MLSKIRAAIIWGKMRHKYLNKDYSGAAALAEKYRRTGVVNDIFSAFDATLDVLNHKSKEALRKYKITAEVVRIKPGDDKLYIYEYCMASIKAIEDNALESETHRKNALKIRTSNYVRKSLPLPDKPMTEL